MLYLTVISSNSYYLGELTESTKKGRQLLNAYKNTAINQINLILHFENFKSSLRTFT